MRSRVLCGLAVTVVVFAGGCAGSGAGGHTSHTPAAVSGAAFPVKVTDCQGNVTTFDAPPTKIVTSNASSLEMLLWLGVGDRVIGTGFPPGKGTMPAQFAEAAAKVPVLGKMVIPKEKLLGSGADLYIDTFAHVGGMAGAGDAPTDQEFTAVGMKRVYLHSTACAASLPGQQQDLSQVEADITSLGALTGTSAKAAELVKTMQQKVGTVRDAISSVAVDQRPSYFFFDFDAGTNQPMAVCGKQVANAVITLAGARNVYADCGADFKPVGWEDVVAKNPDWIQLGVRNRGSDQATTAAFDQAEKFLREFPATQGLTAVKQGHFLRIGSEQTTIAGVRNADTVQQIAATLYPSLVKAGQ